MPHDAIRRASSDFIGRTGARLAEIERKLDGMVPRQAEGIQLALGAFPTRARDGQLVWRADLAPAGWYQYHAPTHTWTPV